MAQVAPVGTFPVSSDVTGTCFVPDVFKDFLSMGVAGLDFARVWNERGTVEGFGMVASELSHAATQFEALARQARAYANAARARVEESSHV